MSDLITYLKNRRNLINVVVLLVLILGIPIGVQLAKQTQIFRSRASGDYIEFKGENVRSTFEGGSTKWFTSSKIVGLVFNGPYGDTTSSPPPSGSPSPGQILTGNRYWAVGYTGQAPAPDNKVVPGTDWPLYEDGVNPFDNAVFKYVCQQAGLTTDNCKFESIWYNKDLFNPGERRIGVTVGNRYWAIGIPGQPAAPGNKVVPGTDWPLYEDGVKIYDNQVFKYMCQQAGLTSDSCHITQLWYDNGFTDPSFKRLVVEIDNKYWNVGLPGQAAAPGNAVIPGTDWPLYEDGKLLTDNPVFKYVCESAGLNSSNCKFDSIWQNQDYTSSGVRQFGVTIGNKYWVFGIPGQPAASGNKVIPGTQWPLYEDGVLLSNNPVFGYMCGRLGLTSSSCHANEIWALADFFSPGERRMGVLIEGPQPSACSRFQQECTSQNGLAGTQWCALSNSCSQDQYGCFTSATGSEKGCFIYNSKTVGSSCSQNNECQTNYCDLSGGTTGICQNMPLSCSDSDGGRVYFSAGRLLGGNNACANGECLDSCSGSSLTEWYCDGGAAKSESFSCPNGCSNGKCVQPDQLPFAGCQLYHSPDIVKTTDNVTFTLKTASSIPDGPAVFRIEAQNPDGTSSNQDVNVNIQNNTYQFAPLAVGSFGQGQLLRIIQVFRNNNQICEAGDSFIIQGGSASLNSSNKIAQSSKKQSDVLGVNFVSKATAQTTTPKASLRFIENDDRSLQGIVGSPFEFGDFVMDASSDGGISTFGMILTKVGSNNMPVRPNIRVKADGYSEFTDSYDCGPGNLTIDIFDKGTKLLPDGTVPNYYQRAVEDSSFPTQFTGRYCYLADFISSPPGTNKGITEQSRVWTPTQTGKYILFTDVTDKTSGTKCTGRPVELGMPLVPPEVRCDQSPNLSVTNPGKDYLVINVAPTSVSQYRWWWSKDGGAESTVFNPPHDLFQPYTQTPMLGTLELDDSVSPGDTVWVYVEYRDVNGQSQTHKKAITYTGGNPVINSVSCGKNLNNQGMVFSIKGQNFGSTPGKIYIGGREFSASNNTWSSSPGQNNPLVVNLNDLSGVTANPAGGYDVNIIRSDGEPSPLASCQIGSLQVNLGPKFFCRLINQRDIPDTSITIADTTTNGAKVTETNAIRAGGSIALNTPLVAGQTYKISIKPPKGLRRNGYFVAPEAGASSGGTVSITPLPVSTSCNNPPEDSQTFNQLVLPYGNIFEPSVSDGLSRIDTFDYSFLKNQWGSKNASAAASLADFNLDGKINSFEYACMRFDIGTCDDTEVTPGPLPASVSGGGSSSNPSSSPVGAQLCNPAAINNNCPAGFICQASPSSSGSINDSGTCVPGPSTPPSFPITSANPNGFCGGPLSVPCSFGLMCQKDDPTRPDSNGTCVPSTSPSPTASACADSDGGLNYNTEGQVTGGDNNPCVGGICQDKCFGGSTVIGGRSVDGTSVLENYCDGNQRRVTNAVDCPKGCIDNHCIP